MLLQVGIALAAGLALGFLIARISGQTNLQLQKQRAAQLEAELAQRTAALEAAQRAMESTRQEQAAREKQWNERDVSQREEIAKLSANCAHLELDSDRAAHALEELREENSRVRNEMSQSHTALATLRTTFEAEQKSAQEKLDLLTNARTELSNQFKSLAGDILKEHSKDFSEQNQTNIGHLLKPVGEALSKLQNTTQELEVKREGAYSTVLTEIKNIQETHQSLRRETTQLIQALRAPKARGNWGQLQLQRCVEFAGMVEHASFDLEVHVRKEDESLRPDCIIYLPNGRTIVIDAKTPFDSFLDAMNTSDEAARDTLLAAHANRVREHLKDLSAKAYWKQFQDSPDFVVCFLPSEVLFSAALEKDPDLIEYGSNSNVILATPTTLIALLKAVAYGWQQMDITRNAIAIREAGQKLYDKLATAQDYFGKMGKALDSAVRQYNSLIGCIEGKGSVFTLARKLHELGIGQDELTEAPPLESATRDLKADDWLSGALSLAAGAEKEP